MCRDARPCRHFWPIKHDFVINISFIQIICNFAKKRKTMPEISRFYGIIIYMYVDDHNPPHFHVWYNGSKAIVDIKTGFVKGALPRRALALVYDWLDMHKEELLDNWARIKEGGKPVDVEPLD